MAKYTVIADTCRTVVEMLKDNLVPEPMSKPESIGVCDPKDRGNFVLGIHPYNIAENKELVTSRPVFLPDGYMQNPPASYQIFCIMSVLSKAEIATRAFDEQRIIGRALQLLKDNTVLPKKYMPESLKISNETINLEILPLELEEKVKIWSMFNEPYKLSIFFSLGPVLIESKQIKAPPARVATIGIEGKIKEWGDIYESS